MCEDLRREGKVLTPEATCRLPCWDMELWVSTATVTVNLVAILLLGDDFVAKDTEQKSSCHIHNVLV